MEDAIHERHAARHVSLLTQCTRAKQNAPAIAARAREARTRSWHVVTTSVRAKRGAARLATRS